MDNSDLQDQIHDAWTVLAHTYRLIGRLWNKDLGEFGFTREQSLNLLIIKRLGENATPYRISRFQAQEHNTVSDILNRMEKDGLLTKIRESQGKSRVKVRLTELGEQAYLKSQKKDSLVKMWSVLSHKELKQLRSSLEKVRDQALKEFDQDQKWPEIRVPPSQWNESDLLKKPINQKLDINSKTKISASKTMKKRGRPRKNIVNS
jgi:DNA-binding MarR family transcriptional regulator